MQKDLKRIGELIEPAIKTVGELQTVWETVSTMLRAVHDLVNDGEEGDDPDFTEIDKGNVAIKWGKLRDYSKSPRCRIRFVRTDVRIVEAFNKVAFVTKNPQKLTIQQWLDNANKRG